MSAERIPLPVTSVTTATLTGIATAVVILLTTHSTLIGGGLTVAAAIGGSVVLAGGLVALERRTPIGVAIGGIAVFSGILLIAASLAVTGSNAPLIAVAAASFTIIGIVTLSLVAIGYTVPSAFMGHNWILIQVAMPLFVLSPVLLYSVISLPSISLSNSAGVRSAYLQVVSELGVQAAVLTAIHLFVIYGLVYVTVSQLVRLDLVGETRRQQVTQLGLKTTFIVGLIVLTPSLLLVIARIGTFTEWITALEGIVPLTELHPVFFGLETLLLGPLCLCYVFRIIRWVRLEQVVTLAAYLAVPIVALVIVTAAFVLLPDGLVIDRLLTYVPGTGGDSVGQVVGIAALAAGLVFVLVTAVLTTLWLIGAGIHRLGRHTLPTIASTGLFIGSGLLGFTGAWPPVVACCLVGSILTWDILENGATLGTQLDGRFNAIQNELAHGIASAAIGVLALAIALGTYLLSTTLQSGQIPSLLSLGPLLLAGIVFALVLWRL